MKINLKNTCFLLASTLLFNNLSADALEVVYPKAPNTEMSATSTFFIGNTKPGSRLTINDKEVKVYENGSFVEVVQLKDGFNRIKIDSQNETEHDILTYIIKKVPKNNLMKQEPQTENFPENEYIYASTIKNNVPLRTEPNENAQRITNLNSDIMLLLNGKKGGYYRVALSPTLNAWVKAENVVNYSTINGQMLASASDVTLTEDKLYYYVKTPLSFKTPYKITETDNGLTLEIFNIKEHLGETKTFKQTGDIKSLVVNMLSTDSVSTYFIELNNQLWGYNVYYEDNTLVLKIRKTPNIDVQNPLKDITITIDAGHGGEDYGAIGPTGVKEKEINLDIAQKLQKILEAKGAKVVMTRTDDSSVELYKRPKIAQESDSLIMISLHANALADGANPYEKHGTSVYYYNKESKDLAQTIKETMLKELQTQDDGTYNCSFVLTRPTMPLSVLVEVAYMIHPDEYSLLLDEQFREKAANSIEKAIEAYLLKSLKTLTITQQ